MNKRNENFTEISVSCGKRCCFLKNCYQRTHFLGQEIGSRDGKYFENHIFSGCLNNEVGKIA
jgi:hypothetical protein